MNTLSKRGLISAKFMIKIINISILMDIKRLLMHYLILIYK